jgi:hypothetical protein
MRFCVVYFVVHKNVLQQDVESTRRQQRLSALDCVRAIRQRRARIESLITGTPVDLLHAVRREIPTHGIVDSFAPLVDR